MNLNIVGTQGIPLARHMEDRIKAVRDEYISRGHTDYSYLSNEANLAYSYAVGAGDYYEVISTYDSIESQNEGGVCHTKGGIYYKLSAINGCSLYAFADSLTNFKSLMADQKMDYILM